MTDLFHLLIFLGSVIYNIHTLNKTEPDSLIIYIDYDYTLEFSNLLARSVLSKMLPLVYILIALPAVVLLLILFKANKNNPPRPPGPRGLPIIGNLHQLDASKLNLQLGQLSKTYGPLFSLRIGFKPALVVSSPKLAKEVLKDHDLDVCTRPPSLGPLKLTYNALELIFSPYNDHWREIRKICVVHFFSSKRISAFSHVRKSEAKRMLQIVSSHVDSSKTTNLTEVLMAVSSAIICRQGWIYL